MRIAMIGQKGIPAVTGGIERHVDELARRLGQQGHEVLVYTRAWYCHAQRDLYPGVSTIETTTIRTKHLDAIVHSLTATWHALRANVDIIHYHGVGPALVAWIPRLLARRIKVVTTFHCIDRKHQKWGRLARWALGAGEWAACRFPHRTITVSRTLEAYCRDRYDQEAIYIPNGVNRPNRQINADRLGQFGLHQNGYLAMVSRLVRHKGAHLLISAYRELKEAGAHRGLKLAIVGDSAFTDDYVAELKALAGNDPDIVFTGTQTGETLEQLFANAYMVVHPSSSEGLPIAVLEAMAYGKAVLGSDIPEIVEVTREHGFAFRNHDQADLTGALADLIRRPEKVAQTGRRARSFVFEDYAWDDIAVRTAELYAQLSQPQRRLAPRNQPEEKRADTAIPA